MGESARGTRWPSVFFGSGGGEEKGEPTAGEIRYVDLA